MNKKLMIGLLIASMGQVMSGAAQDVERKVSAATNHKPDYSYLHSDINGLVVEPIKFNPIAYTLGGATAPLKRIVGETPQKALKAITVDSYRKPNGNPPFF